MQATARHTYLDWLRIGAIAGVLFFHSAMPFVAEWDWHIKNSETSPLLMELNFILSRFRMPLLFFVSGAVTQVMLQRRTAAAFIGLRFRRLLLPLVVGMLTVVPVQVFFERKAEGFAGNFFDFYPSVFTTGAYPAGNLSWHHLWFIAYLFVYDVVLAPLFKWLQQERRSAFFDPLAKGTRIYWIILPSVILYTALSMRFPATNDLINDWCRIFYWMFFLLAGFICMNTPSLLGSIERNRARSLRLAALSLLAINFLRWNKLEPDELFADYQARWQTYAYLSLYALTAWYWVLALVGYGRRYLNRSSPRLPYLNAAVYPFYILHQTVIVVLAFYVVGTNDSVGMKYFFTVGMTAFITLLVIHLFIRPFPPVRLLFGGKGRGKELQKTTSVPVRKEAAGAVLA
jgi:glucan biosynthesis protein C